MKREEFESLVREVVQRELATSLKPLIRKYAKEVVNEAIESFLNSQLNEQAEIPATKPPRARVKPSFLPEAIPPMRAADLAKIPDLRKTGGKVSLNELVALVGNSPPILDESDEWPTIGGKPITAEKAPNWQMERAIMGHPVHEEASDDEEGFGRLAAILKASEKYRGKGVESFNPDLRNK